MAVDDDLPPLPTVRLLSGDVVPDLMRIDRERWREALIPLAEPHRTTAALRSPRGEALELAWRLPPPPSLPPAPAVPMPSARPASRRERQVTIRLRPAELADLDRAAGLLGARRAELARMLVLNGVRRVVAEHDAALDSIRRPGSERGV